jgi:hypothetical protein
LTAVQYLPRVSSSSTSSENNYCLLRLRQASALFPIGGQSRSLNISLSLETAAKYLGFFWVDHWFLRNHTSTVNPPSIFIAEVISRMGSSAITNLERRYGNRYFEFHPGLSFSPGASRGRIISLSTCNTKRRKGSVC